MSVAVRTAVASMLGCLGLVACGEEPPPPPPPPAVQVAVVAQRDVPILVEALGQTRGSTEVEIRARVEGFLETVAFQEGSFVKAGDLLFTIDPAPLEAALAETNAQLAEAEAQLARASQDVVRYKPLVEQNAISKQEYDTAVAFEHAARAMVDAARAVTRSSELNLGYTRVVSPIDGLVGSIQVKPGNLVGRGQNTLLTTVSTIDPIHVRFSISEQDYLKYARRNVEAGAAPGGRAATAPFELILADGKPHTQAGRFVFADASVDAATGTLLMEAAFPNPDRLVRPGQYGRVRVAVDTRAGAILVPQRAVRELQATFSVAVVAEDGTASFRTVTPGARTGSLWVIESGLKAGERVVVEGLQKVREGKPVTATLVELDSVRPATDAPTDNPAGK